MVEYMKQVKKTILLLILLIPLTVLLTGCSRVNKQPRALFSAEPESGKAPLAVTFDGTPSQDPDGDLISYTWEVEGEEFGEKETTNYEFPDPGEYEVKLTVADDSGGSDSTSKTIYVSPPSNQEPNAVISTTPDLYNSTVTIQAGEKVEFDASGSIDPDGKVKTYDWEFGEGEGAAAGKTVTHTYSDSGDYDVTLTVMDDQGANDSKSITVEVRTPPPTPP